MAIDAANSHKSYRTTHEMLQGDKTTGRQNWLETELEQSLIQIAKKCPRIAICMFVDGLDEHDGDDKDLADNLKRLKNLLPQSTRFCISSRSYPDFDAEFGSSMGLKMHECTRRDISLYIGRRLEDARAFGLSRRAVRKLANEVTRMAQGSFLRTRLTCDDLRKDGRRH